MVNHNPVCRCPPSMTGDPFTGCRVMGEGAEGNGCIYRGWKEYGEVVNLKWG